MQTGAVPEARVGDDPVVVGLTHEDARDRVEIAQQLVEEREPHRGAELVVEPLDRLDAGLALDRVFGEERALGHPAIEGVEDLGETLVGEFDVDDRPGNPNHPSDAGCFCHASLLLVQP